eukprot:Pompholyxophrys_punicea_v1_NODE_564_length_1679_cov_15.198276.p1 type:complete len:195 gc:universal NODE_564_length_1679_cov_15.198276:544-1128(+)
MGFKIHSSEEVREQPQPQQSELKQMPSVVPKVVDETPSHAPKHHGMVVYKKPALSEARKAHIEKMNKIRSENAAKRKLERSAKQNLMKSATLSESDIDAIVSAKIKEIEDQQREYELALQEKQRKEQDIEALIEQSVNDYLSAHKKKPIPRKQIERPEPVPVHDELPPQQGAAPGIVAPTPLPPMDKYAVAFGL